jgi:hypothetical protein
MRRSLQGFILGVLLPGAALAQSSASYRLEEHVFNSGGHPSGAGDPASRTFRIPLGAIGDGVAPPLVSGPSFRIEGGFVPAYLPPGEVLNVRFLADHQTLTWDAERSAGRYNLYRDAVPALPGLGYGSCLQQGVPDPAAGDPDLPAPGSGFFYLVTVETRLAEEGTKGFDASGTERGGTLCP